MRPTGFIHDYHALVKGLGSFPAMQLPPSLIFPSELSLYLHNYVVFVSQIEEAGDSDESSRNFIAVIVPFKNTWKFLLLVVHICKKEKKKKKKKKCIYIFDS